MTRRPTFVEGALGVTAFALLVAIALQIFVLNPKADSTQKGLRDTVGAIIAVQIQNCQADHRFREQYKTRGEAEKAILSLFLHLAHKAVDEGNDPGGVSQRFIDKFGPLNRRIHIIPVPDCKEVAARLRKVIENTGVKVPPIPELEALVHPTHRRPAPKYGASGGDAPQTGSTGHQQPGPREGGPSGAGREEQQQGGGGGGSNGAGSGKPPATSPAPADPQTMPPASSPAPSPGRSGDAPGDPEPKPSSPGTVPSAVEAAGGAVKEAGEGVGGAVEGVGKGTDCALRGGC